MGKPDLYRSQIGQDRWVDCIFDQKLGGTFLDVGCAGHELISNTWFLEKHRDWWGIGIDINPIHEQGWICQRPKSRFVCTDATKVDYTALLDAHAMPLTIDYLSIDLEPPRLSMAALERVMQSNRTFLAITFETDFYRQTGTREPSRRLLESAGYSLSKPDVAKQDDFWVLTPARSVS